MAILSINAMTIDDEASRVDRLAAFITEAVNGNWSCTPTDPGG
jgi:hypothetical protein